MSQPPASLSIRLNDTVQVLWRTVLGGSIRIELIIRNSANEFASATQAFKDNAVLHIGDDVSFAFSDIVIDEEKTGLTACRTLR